MTSQWTTEVQTRQKIEIVTEDSKMKFYEKNIFDVKICSDAIKTIDQCISI